MAALHNWKAAVIGCELAFSRHRRQDGLETAPDLGEVGVLATPGGFGGRPVEKDEASFCMWEDWLGLQSSRGRGGGGGEADMALTGAQ